jgi:hypothetical protein
MSLRDMEDNMNGQFSLTRSEIVEGLLRYRDSRSALGVWSRSLGKGMFMCFVKEVVIDEDEDDVVVILKENDLSSQHLETHVLYLSEIEKIYSFRMMPSESLRVRPIDRQE